MSRTVYVNFSKFLGSNFLLTAVNLVRDISIAAAFGTAVAADHFFLATTLLVFLITVASSACRSTYIPNLQNALSKSKPDFQNAVYRLNYVHLWGIAIVSISLFALAITLFLVDRIGAIALMLAATIPMYACSTIVEMSQALLQVKNRILLPNLMRIGLPLGIIAGAGFGFFSQNIYALAGGGLVGASIGVFGIIHSLKKEQLCSVSARKLPTYMGTNIRNSMLALTISSCIAYVNPLVDLWMAGFLGPGAASSLGYASRITVGLASLLIGSIVPVLLNQFSLLVANDNTDRIRTIYSNFLAIGPWVGATITTATWLCSGWVAPLLYQRGQFTVADSLTVVDVIDAYAVQYPFFLTCSIGFTLISALSKNHIFIRLNLILLATNFIADLLLMRIYGLEGLALSTSLVYLVSLISLNVYLLREGTIKPDTASIVSAFLATIAMVMAGLAVKQFDLKITAASSPEKYVNAILLLGTMVCAGLIFNRNRIFNDSFMKRLVLRPHE